MDRLSTFPQVPLRARLAEQGAIAVVGPIVDGLDDLKAGGSKRFDQEFLRHAVTATAPRNAVGMLGVGAWLFVDDGQQSSPGFTARKRLAAI